MFVIFYKTIYPSLTDKRIEIGDELKSSLNAKLQVIEGHIKEHPVITATYFVPDKKRVGENMKV